MAEQEFKPKKSNSGAGALEFNFKQENDAQRLFTKLEMKKAIQIP